MQKLNQKYINSVVKKALDEDLKPRGDITTNLISFKNKKTKAKIIAKQYNRSIIDLKGGGAAGGTAAGMHGFFNASLASGFSLLAEMINLEEKVQKADLIFTAEGKIDEQSIQGKLTGSVAQLAKKYQIPVIGLAGSIKGPYNSLYAAGFSGVFAIQNGPMSLIE